MCKMACFSVTGKRPCARCCATAAQPFLSRLGSHFQKSSTLIVEMFCSFRLFTFRWKKEKWHARHVQNDLFSVTGKRPCARCCATAAQPFLSRLGSHFQKSSTLIVEMFCSFRLFTFRWKKEKWHARHVQNDLFFFHL